MGWEEPRRGGGGVAGRLTLIAATGMQFVISPLLWTCSLPASTDGLVYAHSLIHSLTHSFIHSYESLCIPTYSVHTQRCLSMVCVSSACVTHRRARGCVYIYIHRSSWNRFFGGLLRCTWTRKWLCEHELTTIAYLHNSIGHG